MHLPTIVAVAVAIILQVALFFGVLSRTRSPLVKATVALKNALGKASRIGGDGFGAYYPRLSHALNITIGRIAQTGTFQPVEPELAFEPSRLLPPEYNSRLDSVAPGIFTAVGIIGTFVGLVIAFWDIDPADAMSSMPLLLGGMRVAFLNSLVGVLLSVIWTLWSRTWRHAFDLACEDLRFAVEAAHPGLIGGGQVLSLLTQLSENIRALQSSTDQSSRVLLDGLSKNLEKSFEAMVSMPFDRLNESVGNFGEVANILMAQQRAASEQIQSATTALAVAKTELAVSVEATKSCVDQFNVTTSGLHAVTERARGLIDSATEAAESLSTVSHEVLKASDRYESIGEALSNLTGKLSDTSNSVSASANAFGSATERLELATRTIQEASDRVVNDSMDTVRQQLQTAISELVVQLGETSKNTISAYQVSTEAVIEAVDERMSDLTDRLSAELTTLAARLPAEVEALNRAMDQIRTQIQVATRSMDSAVQQLAQETPKKLQTHLDVYDGALAKAMDHFSGTLADWNGKIAEVATLSAALHRLTELAEKQFRTERTIGVELADA